MPKPPNVSKTLYILAAALLLFCIGSSTKGDEQAAKSDSVPDATALLLQVQENQKIIDKLQEQYACRKNIEELESIKNGGFRTKGSKDFEVFYLDGREIDRLVAKNGKPLSPGEAQDENARAEKKVKEFQKKQQQKTDRAARGESKREDEPGISTFLRVTKFTNPRRVEFRGRNVIAFDFEPLPGYKPKTRLEKVLQGLVGTAWVDEAAKEIVKLEAHFAKSLKFGGGLLASVRPGSAFVFEQALVNNEVWLPIYAEIHLSARVLIKGVKVDQIVRYSDYRKFRVEMLNQIGSPKDKKD
jgi:hypothetical protein